MISFFPVSDRYERIPAVFLANTRFTFMTTQHDATSILRRVALIGSIFEKEGAIPVINVLRYTPDPKAGKYVMIIHNEKCGSKSLAGV
jgi:hypothetical protein